MRQNDRMFSNLFPLLIPTNSLKFVDLFRNAGPKITYPNLTPRPSLLELACTDS